MAYDLLKKCVSIFFNILNLLLGGNLPPFTSACVVVEEDDHYLVIELPGNRVVFPGGFLKHNETPKQGAEREGCEETGLQIQVDDLINYYALKNNNWRVMNNVSFAFHGKVVGGELRNNIEGRPYWLQETKLRARLSGHSCMILNDYLNYRTQHHDQHKHHPTLVSFAL